MEESLRAAAEIHHNRPVQGPHRYRLEIVIAASPLAKFAGILNQKHRAFILSADLAGSEETAPWTTPCTPSEPKWATLLDFAKTICGPYDFVFCFDGRCGRTCRRQIEDAFPNSEEMWIIYQCASGIGVGSKVAFSSKNTEMAFVKLPVSRDRLTTKARSSYTAVGERSIQDSTWTAVPLPNVRRLPFISVEQ